MAELFATNMILGLIIVFGGWSWYRLVRAIELTMFQEEEHEDERDAGEV